MEKEPKPEDKETNLDLLDCFDKLLDKVSNTESFDKIYSFTKENLENILDYIKENQEINERYLEILKTTEAKLEVLAIKLDSFWFKNQQNEKYKNFIDSIFGLIKKINKEKTETTLNIAGPEYAKAWGIIQSKEKYSVIRDIKVEDVRDSELKVANFTPSFSHYEDSKIKIPIENESGYIEFVMENREELLKIIKERLEEKGVEVDNIDDDFLQFFIFLHELGHAYDYLTNDEGESVEQPPNEQEYRERNKKAKPLPIPHMKPAVFVRMVKEYGWDQDDEIWKETRDDFEENGRINNEKIKEADNTDEALAIIERAYKNLDSEAAADDFATDFIAEHFHNSEEQ